MEPLTLLVVDDHTDMLYLLQGRLAHDGFQVLAAESGRQALLAVEQCRLDLAIVNLLLRDVNSLYLAELIKRRGDIPVLFVTPIHGIRTRAAEIRACAADYIVEPFEYEELLDRIRRVLCHTNQPAGGEQTPGSDAGLTPRQVEVLRLAASGATDNQIAIKLIISAQTVSWHMARIRARLGVRSRTEAVVVALQRGLLAPR